MQLTEISYPDGTPIDGYGPGFFRLGGQRHEGALLILPEGISNWGGYEDAEALLAASDTIDVLLLGTGAEITPLPQVFRTALEEADIGLEIMASPTAARSYNMLLAEGRRVAAALLPV